MISSFFIEASIVIDVIPTVVVVVLSITLLVVLSISLVVVLSISIVVVFNPVSIVMDGLHGKLHVKPGTEIVIFLLTSVVKKQKHKLNHAFLTWPHSYKLSNLNCFLNFF